MTYEDLTNEQLERYDNVCGHLCDGYVPYGMREQYNALRKAWGDDHNVLFRTRFDALMNVAVFRNYVMGA